MAIVTEIIGVITAAIGDLAESFAASFVDTFMALFTVTDATTHAISLSTYGVFALCGVGIGFCIAIIRILMRKKSGL